MHEKYVFSSAFTSLCDITLPGHLPLEKVAQERVREKENER